MQIFLNILISSTFLVFYRMMSRCGSPVMDLPIGTLLPCSGIFLSRLIFKMQGFGKDVLISVGP